jgi:phage/plasmid-associated DNA primase
MKTFGEYCSTAPTSLVTGKRTDSSNATPELCHVERRLVVFLQEPNPEEKIKAGKMKEMTGNDSMYVRQLFKSGKTMVLKAKIVIVCNNIIDIPGMDAAIRRRIVVLPFISTFLDPAEYKAQQAKGTLEPNTNIIDLSVEKELIRYKSAFMYVLCRRYREWVHNENMLLNIPDVIKTVTENYITYNNYQLRFIKKFLHHVNGSTMAASDIYESFKEWFRKSYPGKKVQDFEKFTKEMSNEGYLDDGDGTIRDVFMSYNDEHIN